MLTMAVGERQGTMVTDDLLQAPRLAADLAAFART